MTDFEKALLADAISSQRNTSGISEQVTNARRDLYGRVIVIRTAGAGVYTASEAFAMIQLNKNRFYTLTHFGMRSYIEAVAIGPGHPAYLRTRGDTSTSNNLDNLPPF